MRYIICKMAKSSARKLLLAILLLTAALVWHDLGVHEVLGRDENATITKLDQPDLKSVLDVTYMNITGHSGNMQPLYFLIQHLFWPVIGRSAFMLRFFSSVAGLLTVLMAFKLGEQLVGREAGLIGALLTALLPLQLRYAQIARPYTLLAFFSLISAYWLVRALRTNRLLHWAAFALAAVLGFYTHYNTLFVLAAEGLFTAIVWLTVLARVFKREQTPGRLVRPVFGFALVGLFCLPGLVHLLGLSWVGLEEGAEAAGGEMLSLTVPFFRHLAYESGLATTRWLQNLLALLMLVGPAAALVRRRWQPALFAVLWLAVPFVALAVINSPRPFEERYVIFVMPVAFLLVGQAVAAVGGWLALLTHRHSRPAVRRAITLILTAGLAWTLVGRVGAYYAENRQVDRLDQTLMVVERQARPGDVIIVSPRFFVRPLIAPGVEVLYLAEHPSAGDLDALAAQHERMWLLYTSYLGNVELQEPLDRWVQANSDRFVEVPIKALNALAFGTRASAGAESELKDRITTLEVLAQNSAGESEAAQRYGLLADAYVEMAGLYAGRHEDTLAAEYRHRAEQARAAHPAP